MRFESVQVDIAEKAALLQANHKIGYGFIVQCNTSDVDSSILVLHPGEPHAFGYDYLSHGVHQPGGFKAVGLKGFHDFHFLLQVAEFFLYFFYFFIDLFVFF